MGSWRRPTLILQSIFSVPLSYLRGSWQTKQPIFSAVWERAFLLPWHTSETYVFRHYKVYMGVTPWCPLCDSKYTVPNQWWIQKYLEGRIRGLFKEISRKVFGETEENKAWHLIWLLHLDSKKVRGFFIALHKIKRTKYNVFWEKPLIARK